MKKKLLAYDPAKIEKKWQKKWASSKIYRSKESAGKKKAYILDMFPYPSGEGLHVGHPKGYIATDVVSRMKRMQGLNVLHPMGFDAFGLPAENYAIKMKTNPMVGVAKNVKRFKEQLEIIGLDYDWSREVNTTDPKFYKWTQWIFLQLLKKGLAYESNEPVNWCPTDKTVLANEDVENGRCERCGTPVEKRPMRQWVLKITDYADRLLKDLDTKVAHGKSLLDWPESIKESQRNWIGKSEGALIRFPIKQDADFVLIHGWEGSPQSDFFPWLKSELEKRGYRVQVPALPNPDEPVIKDQVEHVLHTCKFDEKTIVLGHSLGCTVAMKVLERLPHPVRKLVLAAPFIANEFKDGSTFEKSTHDWKYDFKAIRSKTGGVTILRDLKDHLVPSDQADDIRSKLGGTVIDFKAVKGHITAKEEPFLLSVLVPEIDIFTTRPDTLFGVTYVVLAPEHKLVNDLLPLVSNKPEVDAYISNAQRETEIQRTDASKEKTGIELKGIKAVNPANSEEVPVWIADYVLADYGTGAVMAVPAHDDRDWQFAKKFKLPTRQVIEPTYTQSTEPGKVVEGMPFEHRNAIIAIVKHWSEDKYIGLKWKKVAWGTFITGGIEEGQTAETACKAEIREETGYLNPKLVSDFGVINGKFYHVPKKVNRFAHARTLYFKLENGDREETADKEKDIHDVCWLTAEELAKFLTPDSHQHALRIMTGTQRAFTGEGILMNSGKFDGKDSGAVMKEITEFADGKWTTKYKLRDWVFSRQRYWGEPIPVIHCDKCGVVPVPEKDLPVKLPKVKSYEPTGTGESPLAAISKWVNVKCPKCGGKGKRETNTMPQWAGSSWYYLRYEDPKNAKRLVDLKNEKYWSPVDLYVGGAEHATRHLIYARFWHKFLYDIGAVSGIEPFAKLQSVGLIMGEDGRKMSKRFGNVVNPDEIVKTYGADTLRVYEMFMGPFDQAIPWSTDSIIGSRRFIERVWKLAEKVEVKGAAVSRTIHKTVKKVTEDIENLRFNTAISTLMIALNELDKAENVSRADFESYLKLLAPFAPHAAEELWSALGNKKSIHISSWPTYDPALIADKESRITLQVNGKVRGSFMVSAGTGKDNLEALAKALPEAKKWLEGKQIRRVIAVVDRLVNIVAV